MKKKLFTGISVLGILLCLLGAVAIEKFVISPNTVSSYSDLFDRYILERSSIPPLPSPVPYMDVLTSLQANDGSFLNTKFWTYDHTGSTLYLAKDSSLAKQLKPPMELMIQEDILRGEVTIWGKPLGADQYKGLALFDAPEFMSFSSEDGVSIEKFLMDEFAPRRVTMHFVLKSEEDAWSDLLIAQEQAEAVAMPMMAMSSSETITDFRILQDGTNLSVNLPDEFVGADIMLLDCTNLVEGTWITVSTNQASSSGIMTLGSADIPSLIYETSVSTNWVNCPNHTMPGEICTNQTLVVSTNSTQIGGGVIYYRTSASSTVDSDNDDLGNLAEYELGTDYQDSDSDNDGIPDGYEVDYGFDPLLFSDGATDPDADNLVNSNEYLHSTLPNDPDTDNDGLPDGWEVQNGFDPLDAFDATDDIDHDGFITVYEYAHGTGYDDPESLPVPTRYVSLTGAHIAPYSTLSTAATNIQAALDAATNNFEIISVAEGTYIGPGNHKLLFPANPVMLFSEASSSDCVIECKSLVGGIFDRGAAFSCSDVVNGFTVLKNLAIKDGYAVRPLNCSNSKLLISGCLIADHVGDSGWPSFIVETNSYVMMRDTIASYFKTSENNPRTFMFADSSNIKMERCEILHNYQGVQLTGTSSLEGCATRIKCIASNQTHTAGVLIGSDCEVSGLLLEENAAGVDCLIYPGSALIRNCVMLDNDEGITGWWLYNNLEVQHCTIMDNNVGIHGSDAVVQNVILWGNGQQASDSNLVISSSCVQGGWPGTGNISVDPLIEFEYNLASNSPCLNAGTTNAALGYDVDGYERDTSPDMGAAEYIDLNIDSDGDGLPDWWEVRYGLSAASTNGINGADGDFDGDGLDNGYEYSLQSSPSYGNSVQLAFPSVQTRSTEVDMPKFGFDDFDPDEPRTLYLKKTGLYERDYSYSDSDSSSSEDILWTQVAEYSGAGSLTTNYIGSYLYSNSGISIGEDGGELSWATTKNGMCQSDGTFSGTESGWIDFPDDGLGPIYNTNTFSNLTVNLPGFTATNSSTERTSGLVPDSSGHYTGYDEYTETLTNEHTTELMVTNAERLVSATVGIPEYGVPVGPLGEGRRYSFESNVWEVVIAEQMALRDLATNETNIVLRKMDCRFVLQGERGVVYQITPYKLFTPEDGSTPQLTQLGAIQVLGTGEEQIVTGHDIHVDPPAVDGTAEIITLSVNLTAYRPTTDPFLRHTVPDDQEESPGAGVRINGDSDASADENDLIEVELEALSGPASSNIVYVLRRNNSNIKVWSDQQMTTALLDSGTETAITVGSSSRSVWVENPNGGTADLELVAKDSNGNDISSDKIHFYPFTSIVVLFEGEFGDPGDPPQTGISQLALDIYENGYDVHLYEEPDSGDNPNAEVQAFSEIETAAENRQANSVAIIGYSHGGGSTFNVSEALNNDPTAFNLNFTAYIDAVTQDAITQENRRPANSAFHVNYYQEGSVADLGLDGGPIDDPPGAEFEVNVDDPVATETHTTIDDDAAVHAGITTRLYQRINR